MVISKIESVPAWGDKDLPAAESLLVKVTTDDGLEGWGEAFGFRAVSSAKLAIDELIALSRVVSRMRTTPLRASTIFRSAGAAAKRKRRTISTNNE